MEYFDNSHFFGGCGRDIKHYVHPLTREFIAPGVPLNSLKGRHVEASFLAFDGCHEPIQKLVKLWRRCATQRRCIAPEGSNRGNHRQDQTALSLYMFTTKLVHCHTGFFGAELHKEI